MSHPPCASHIPLAGCVFSQTGSGARTSKPTVQENQQRGTHSFRTRLELEQCNGILILLAKALSKRGLGLQNDGIKGLDTGRGGELKPFLHSVISYQWTTIHLGSPRRVSVHSCYSYKMVSSTPLTLKIVLI